MGLDNAIYIKFKEKRDFPWIQPCTYDPLCFEICYWRKCWNVRGVIAEILAACRKKNEVSWKYPHTDSDSTDPSLFGSVFSCQMSLNCLEEILNKLRDDIYSYEGWDRSNSIWAWIDYDEERDESLGVADHFWYDLTKAFQMLEVLRTLPSDSYTIEFLDSY